MTRRRPLVLFVLRSLLLVVAAGCVGPRPDPGYAISMETQPSPMQNGRVSTVMVRVKQPDGAPLIGAKVTFKAQHATMQHGAGTVATQEREPGVYAAEYLPSMSGSYRVTVNVEAPQGQAERVLDASVR